MSNLTFYKFINLFFYLILISYRLKQHIRAEHKEEYLTCKVCSKKFKTRKYLTRHFRNVHPTEKISDEIETTLSNLDSKSNQMKCTIDNCDKKFVKRFV